MNAYLELEQRQERITALNNAIGILQWDQETMMPAGAAPARARVMAEMDVMVHELETAADLPELIERAGTECATLDTWQRANLREIEHGFLHANAVPAALVEQLALASSDANMTWRAARDEDDYARLAPKLDHLFTLKREEAAIKSEALGVSPYEALMDQFDPGRREAQVDTIFDDLADFLPDVLQQAMAHQEALGPPLAIPGPFPVQRQRQLGLEVMKILGFPFDRGRLDIAHHPFSGGAQGDVRITTRYDESDFTRSLMAVIHETGHALYEDGLPPDWASQPVGRSRGMTLHESQSLLLEMQAARTEEFIAYLAPVIRRELGGEGAAWGPDNLLRLYRRVEPGLIRVYADEVTYPLHVILRYRLEKAIVAGELTAPDLPAAWSDLMASLVGIRPDNDRDGVMQDVHWPEGILGYFPTYSLGAVAAAQIFAAAKRHEPELLPGLARGDLRPLYRWLDSHVRSQGSLYLPDELIERATGAPLGTEAFKANLLARYTI